MASGRLVAACAALSVALPAVLTGCGAPALTELPPGVLVSVHQNRPDGAERRLQVRITNEADAPLTITRLAFASPAFDSPAEYGKAPTTIRAGGIIDLPVSLAGPVCGGTDTTPSVMLDFAVGAVGGGATAHSGEGHAVVTPDDPLGQLPGITAHDCLAASIAAVAEIREPSVLRTQEVAGRLVAMVDLEILPTGASGSFTIDAVDDTVLLSLFDTANSRPVDTLPIGLEVNGDDEPTTVTIPLIPARCDAHAVAEDKRGTLLPLRVEVGPVTGISYFAASEELKGALFSYIDAACPRR